MPVSGRRLAIDEVFAAQEEGKLKEVFASGTAAVISPIGTLNYNGEDHAVADGNVGPLAQKLYGTLFGVRTGTAEDFMGPDLSAWPEGLTARRSVSLSCKNHM